MLGKGKVSQSLIDAVQKIQEYETKDGKFVHKARPGSYGGSSQEPRSAFDVLSGPKKKDIEAMEKKPVKKEEVEPIDELSKKTLGSYAKKATDDVSYHSFDAGNRSDRDPERLKADKKAMSRQAGVNKAVDRLAKEDTDDCVSPAQAKKIADKEVGKHEKKLHKESAFKSKLIEAIKHKEKEEELVDESEMSDSQMKKREKIVMAMKGKEADFRKKYGKNWKNVMYATATKQAMKEEFEDSEQVDEEESGLRMAAHAAARDGKKMFKFQGKTLPVKVKSEETEIEEGITSIIKKGLKTAGRVLGGPDDKGQLKDLQRKIGLPQTGKVPHARQNEEFVSEKNDSHTHAAHYEDPKTGEWSGMQLISAKDDQDAIKQAQAKCKEGCRLSKVERHMTVKEETISEAEVTTSTDTPELYVTDMLQGRVKGGKVNSFKSFKAQLRTDGEMKAPKEIDQGEDTREKQKITTNPGPVNVKMDDKLAGPTPFTHHATEKKVTSEEVRGKLKHIRSKEEKNYNKEVGDFKKKLLTKQVKQEGKDPMMDAGVGSTPDFATNESGKKTPMSKVKDLARSALKKTKNEVLGIAPDNN
jgi:hypothetical protein